MAVDIYSVYPRLWSGEWSAYDAWLGPLDPPCCVDNTVLNSGAGGDTIASDDIAGIKHQRVKLSVGADGSASDAVPVSNGMDVTGAAVQAVGLVAQLDDTTTGAVTENQFAPVRLSTRRALLVEGVASGTGFNVTSAGANIATETSLSALAGDVGDTADAAATAGSTGTLHAKQRLMTSQLDSIKTAVETLDNAISGTEMQVDVVAALPAGTNNIGDIDVLSVVPGTGATNLGKAIDTATGATDTGVLALVTRDDALSALTPIDGDNVSLRVDANGALWTHDDVLEAALSGSELQVDIVAALPAGTNNIGDVDVLSVIPGTGATNLGKAIDTAVGATDTGVLILARRDDALAALTPIESDAVELRTDANGALWTHDDALDAALAGSELQVDIVGALPTGANTIGTVNIGTFPDNEPFNAAQWGGTAVTGGSGTATAGSPRVVLATDVALPAGTNNIGDVDVLSVVPGTGATNLGKAEDAAHTSGDVGVMALGVRNDTPNVAIAGADLDYTPIATSKTGAVFVQHSEEDFAVLGSNKVNKPFNLTGAQTDAIIWSPAVGKRWYITDIQFVVSAAATVTWEDDVVAGDVNIGLGGAFAANSGIARSFITPVFSTEDAADLLLTTSAGNIQGIVTGYEV